MFVAVVARADEHIAVIMVVCLCILLVIPPARPRVWHWRMDEHPIMVHFTNLTLVRVHEVFDHLQFIAHACYLLIQLGVWVLWQLLEQFET